MEPRNKSRVTKRTKRKKRKLRKIWKMLLFVLLICVLWGIYYIYDTYSALNKTYDDLNREKSDLREKIVNFTEDPVSILLLGIEDYETNGKNGRSDALMVATFNPKDDSVQLLSIPRDSLVEIDGYGLDKINHAHAFGGVELTIDTVEQFLDIPIDYYVKVDFEAFVKIIDILGGITVTVPFNFSEWTMGENRKRVDFIEGEMHVNGDEALAFARMRKQDPRGDIGRNARQQEVIKGIIERFLSFESLTKVDNIAHEIGDNVQTNLKVSEGLSFLLQNSNFNLNNLQQLKLDTYSDRYNGASVQIVDEDSLLEVQTLLKQHLDLIKNKDSISSIQ